MELFTLLAQADTAGWADSITQLATATGFGGLVWYLVVKHIPAIEERHRQERKELLAYISERDEKLEQISMRFCESIDRIEDHIDGLVQRLEAKLDAINNVNDGRKND